MRTTIQTLFALTASAWNLRDYDAHLQSRGLGIAYEREDEHIFGPIIEPSLVIDENQIIDAEDQNNFTKGNFPDDDRVLILAGGNKVYTAYPTRSFNHVREE